MAERDRNGHPVMRRWLPAAALALLGLAAASSARATAQGAPTPDPSDIAEGRRLFELKGNCQACHGWSGDGHKTDNQMPDAQTCARRSSLAQGSS